MDGLFYGFIAFAILVMWWLAAGTFRQMEASGFFRTDRRERESADYHEVYGDEPDTDYFDGEIDHEYAEWDYGRTYGKEAAPGDEFTDETVQPVARKKQVAS